MRLRRPSPALVIACLALLVSLSGTGIAAVNALPRGSVGPVQLQTGAVSSIKVKDGALRLLDFGAAERAKLKGDTGPAGSQGPKGDKGDKGVKGDTGAQGLQGVPGLSGYTLVEKFQSTTASSMGIQVSCPSGKRPLGGGGGTSTPGAGVTIRNSFASGSTWLVVVDAKSPGSGWSYTAKAAARRSRPDFLEPPQLRAHQAGRPLDEQAVVRVVQPAARARGVRQDDGGGGVVGEALPDAVV